MMAWDGRTLAEACASHPSLTTLAVANQCNQELLSQPALIAMLAAMESTPKITQLKLGAPAMMATCDGPR